MKFKEISTAVHWSKPIFDKHKIPLKVISTFIDLNYFYASRILNGTIKPSDSVEKKIRTLVNHIQDQGGHDG